MLVCCAIKDSGRWHRKAYITCLFLSAELALARVYASSPSPPSLRLLASLCHVTRPIEQRNK